MKPQHRKSRRSDKRASYLVGGHIAVEAMAALFTVARSLYRVAPWKVATDDQVLRVDIPELDVE